MPGRACLADASGYDLKKFFETIFSHCCAAGYGSIHEPDRKNAASDEFVLGFGATVMSAASNYLRAHRHALIAAAPANAYLYTISKHRNDPGRSAHQNC
ncbi:MAG: hypothetical protein WBR29_03710 [Gammaproteobacteria bacterium]